MKNSKAFTLIEVLISIGLMGIMFIYLSSTVNSVKIQNAHYIGISDKVKTEKRIYRLFNLDLTQIIGKVKITNNTNFDIIEFQSKNSIYGIIYPTIYYLVSKKENALIRIESLDAFKFDNKEDISNIFLYADILAKDCISFKVYFKKGFIGLLFRAKDLRPMVLQIPTIS